MCSYGATTVDYNGFLNFLFHHITIDKYVINHDEKEFIVVGRNISVVKCILCKVYLF